MTQVTMYLADDVLDEVEQLRIKTREPGMPIQSRTKILEGIVWAGLPTHSQQNIHRARRAKREGKA